MNIIDFKGNQPVRIFGDGKNPLFCAADVCRILEISNARDAVSSLDEDEKSTVANPDGRVGSGAQVFNCVTESGLYHLIFKSRKAAAKDFRRWVTMEVLPEIRRSGGYSVPGVTQLKSVIEFALGKDEEIDYKKLEKFGREVQKVATGVRLKKEFVSGYSGEKYVGFPVDLMERVWIKDAVTTTGSGGGQGSVIVLRWPEHWQFAAMRLARSIYKQFAPVKWAFIAHEIIDFEYFGIKKIGPAERSRIGKYIQACGYFNIQGYGRNREYTVKAEKVAELFTYLHGDDQGKEWEEVSIPVKGEIK